MTPGQRQLTVVVAVDAWMVELRQQTCYCVCLSNIPFPGRKETKAQAAGENAAHLSEREAVLKPPVQHSGQKPCVPQGLHWPRKEDCCTAVKSETR